MMLGNAVVTCRVGSSEKVIEVGVAFHRVTCRVGSSERSRGH